MAKVVKKPSEKAGKKPVAKKDTKKPAAAPAKKKTTPKEKEPPVDEPKPVVKRLAKEETEEKGEISTEKKLIALYTLQQIDTQIDKIRIIRGELPLEVQDLEDEIAGLQTRIDNYQATLTDLTKKIAERKNSIKESQSLIKKYTEQQNNVRNNREYDSLSKEIEYQNLEIQLSEKRIKEFSFDLDQKKEEIEKATEILNERNNDLEVKKGELEDIVAETEKEEKDLIHRSEKNRKVIEDRLLTAYTRIRRNARNGLAVVQIERDACGGCFNKIPPQHQLDIRLHKKIIVCEYCGRILVDEGIVNMIH